MMAVKERWDGRRERERHKEKEICELAGVIVCVGNMGMSAEPCVNISFHVLAKQFNGMK